MRADKSLSREMLGLLVEGTELTPKERQTLKLIAMGYSVPSVADKLGRSPETIRTHTKTARARLGAKTTCQAVAIAISADLI